MSASESDSSTTPPPKLTTKKPKKSVKSDLKGKKQVTLPVESKNERINWDYSPPKGAVLINFDEEDAGPFDWDAVNDDPDVELCLIRIPEAVKPKHLENMAIKIPSSSRTSCIGTLKRKYMSYDLWNLGENDGESFVGGEETKGISCLLPRKKENGELYLSSKPITRHLILAAQSVKPTPLPNDSTTATDLKNPPRPSYPKHLLKHRFMPYGSLTKPRNSLRVNVDIMEAPEDGITVVQHSTPSKRRKGKGKEVESGDIIEILPTKTKKRKVHHVDGEITETPVSKKHKKKKEVS